MNGGEQKLVIYSAVTIQHVNNYMGVVQSLPLPP